MTTLHSSLIQQLEATDHGDPWYGSSRAALLNGLTAENAAAHPIPGGHSIWELVLHMTAWTNEVRRRVAGQPPAEPVEGDWPAVGAVSDVAWAAARSALSDANAHFITAVKALAASRWDEPIGPVRDPALGTGVSVAGTLVGLAQHDAYHTGQVALLRRAVGS